MFIHNVCVHAVYNAHLWVCLYTHKVMMYNFMYGWVYVQCTLCTVYPFVYDCGTVCVQCTLYVPICVQLWYKLCTLYLPICVRLCYCLCTYLCMTVVLFVYNVHCIYIFVYDCGTFCVQCTMYVPFCVRLCYCLCTMYTVCTYLCKTVLLSVYNVHCKYCGTQSTLYLPICVWLCYCLCTMYTVSTYFLRMWYFLCTMSTVCTYLYMAVVLFANNVHCTYLFV